MNNKIKWVKIAAIATTIVGAAVAVAAFVKSKSKRLSEELDFDNSLYFDDDDTFMDEEILGEGDLEHPVHTSKTEDFESELDVETETEEAEEAEDEKTSDKDNEI